MERCRIERGKDGIIKKADRRYVERAANEKIDNQELNEKRKYFWASECEVETICGKSIRIGFSSSSIIMLNSLKSLWITP